MILGPDGPFEDYLSTLEREILVALATGKIQPGEVARVVRTPIFNSSTTLPSQICWTAGSRPWQTRIFS
ncbi:MAG: hypothetical protein JRN23_02020 [Nitrososphaerota archaeon]|nr:hypothetical protein [Nitrososphaerota archaeon]